MYKLKIEFSWDTYDCDEVMASMMDSSRTLITIVFTKNLELVKGLLLDMDNGQEKFKLTLDNPNCQLIYPHCRLKTGETQENMIAMVIDYGTTN